jgi:putative thioredoxin
MIEQNLDSPYIHAATADNFNTLVLENSNQGPVLVNFWSKKAGPCLRQYPILDKLIYQLEGKVLLINIDTDSDYEITNRYGITSVPTLKLFLKETIVDTRYGFQSEEDLSKLLKQYVVRPSDKILAEAVRLYSLNARSKAIELITQTIVDDPTNPRLPLALCKILKHEGRYTEADKILTSLPEEISKNQAIKILHYLISFYLLIDETNTIDSLLEQLNESPDNLELRKQLSAWYVTEQQFELAINELITIIETNKTFDNNYPKHALLKIFTLLGYEHELVKKYRTKLNHYTH